jgi:LPXTG-motif cell wall-anchored protein
MQLAGPSAENEAEDGSQSAGAPMAMASATPVRLPVTGGSASLSALWLGAALAGVALVAFGTFRLILSQVRTER